MEFMVDMKLQHVHLIDQFAVDSGLASFNEVKIVPLTTFQSVVERVKKIHGL